MLKGLTTKEIAQAMQRSPRSIDAHGFTINASRFDAARKKKF
ncbi:MAG: hypothetical protein ACK4XY_12375 [Chloroherpetonaceae bacterium]